MTPKLGPLSYNAQTLAALAKWADVGAKKPKRDYRRRFKENKAVTTRTTDAAANKPR